MNNLKIVLMIDLQQSNLSKTNMKLSYLFND